MTFALVTAACAGAFAAGFVMARTGRRELPWIAALCAAPVLFRVLLIRWELLGPEMFPYDGYPVVEHAWFTPFASVLFGAGTGRVRAIILRDVALIAAGLGLVYFFYGAWAKSFSPNEALDGSVDETGYLRQTSMYSCGAAAAAMYLHSLNLPATEAEMARLSATDQLHGTTVSGLVSGLAAKIPGGRSRIRFAEVSHEELAALRRPALVIMDWGVVLHWIVVDGCSGREVFIRDPSWSQRSMPLDAFLEEFQGIAVWAEPGGAVGDR